MNATAPREGSIPRFDVVQAALNQGDARPLYKTLEMLWRRTGGHQDGPHDDHMRSRVSDAELSEVSNRLEAAEAQLRSLSEGSADSIRGSLESITDMIAGVGDIAEAASTGGALEDQLAELSNTLSGFVESVQADLEPLIRQLQDDVDTIAPLLIAARSELDPASIISAGNLLVEGDIGQSVQAHDGETTKNDQQNTFTETNIVSKDNPVFIFNDTDTSLSNNEAAGGFRFDQSDASGAGTGAWLRVRGVGSTGQVRLVVETGGNGTTAECASFHPDGEFIIHGTTLQIETQETPASAAATGTKGFIVHDTDYIYVCVANNTWKRAALSTW